MTILIAHCSDLLTHSTLTRELTTLQDLNLYNIRKIMKEHGIMKLKNWQSINVGGGSFLFGVA